MGRSRRADDRTFAGTCATLRLGPKSVVGRVANSGVERILQDAMNSKVSPRRAICAEFGVQSICLIPATGGVLEFGTSEVWNEIPPHPVLPKAEMKTAFDSFGAVYCMLWVENSQGNWVVVADFVTLEHQTALKNSRGDSNTFASQSKFLQLPPTSTVGKVNKDQIPCSIEHAQTNPQFERQEMAQDFCIKCVRMVPCGGCVLEYGMDVAHEEGELQLVVEVAEEDGELHQ